MPVRFTVVPLVFALAALSAACGDEGSAGRTVDARDGAEAVAEELSGNVENSGRVYDEAYDDARKRGENPIEAAGEAYDAVLATPEEKEKESP